MWRNTIFEGGADCDTDRCLVVRKVRERLSVSKQMANNFDVEKYHLKQLNNMEVREQNQPKVLEKAVALEILSDNGALIGLGKILERI
jgi:hypothetical protein